MARSTLSLTLPLSLSLPLPLPLILVLPLPLSLVLILPWSLPRITPICRCRKSICCLLQTLSGLIDGAGLCLSCSSIIGSCLDCITCISDIRLVPISNSLGKLMQSCTELGVLAGCIGCLLNLLCQLCTLRSSHLARLGRQVLQCFCKLASPLYRIAIRQGFGQGLERGIRTALQGRTGSSHRLRLIGSIGVLQLGDFGLCLRKYLLSICFIFRML